MPTLELSISLPLQHHEFLIAELADLDFDAFEQEDEKLLAYQPAAQWTDSKREHLERWLVAGGFDRQFTEHIMPDQDWNAVWEAQIKPLAVGPFVIQPTWSKEPPPPGKQVLWIDPKMSFGTGYHESTRLALRFLADMDVKGKSVLDVGTGTGVLAIAALSRGANYAIGVDIDPWSVTNGEENAHRNGMADVLEICEGSIESVPEAEFDLIFANINRNALIALMPELAARLTPAGHLIIAGLLIDDRPTMLGTLRRSQLSVASEAEEGDWWAAVVRPGGA
ncbi:50S ribosomal protein L11 methyltransferase [soil metagenome]